MKSIKGIYSNIRSMYDPLYLTECYCREDLKRKLQAIAIKPISSNSKRKIKELWGKSSPWFDYYNSVGDSNRVHLYFPEPWYFKHIDASLNNWTVCRAIDDKCLYDYFFYDIRRPRTVLKICNGMYLDASSRILTLAEAAATCHAVGRVIIKPSVGSSGGEGILFWDENNGIDIESVLRDSKDEVVQEVIGQHATLDQIHTGSINTIRILTLTTENGVKVISSILRAGVGKAKVDNFSRGGVAFGIDSEGKLKEKGWSILGISHNGHPDGAKTLGVQLPGYFDCVDICKAAAPRFARFSRLISWDFAIDPDSKPFLVEANLNHGGISTHQICNGPIFGDEETTRYMIKKFVK